VTLIRRIRTKPSIPVLVGDNANKGGYKRGDGKRVFDLGCGALSGRI
jgi:hypothetical protein